jgi:cell shape-determining protein MreC
MPIHNESFENSLMADMQQRYIRAEKKVAELEAEVERYKKNDQRYTRWAEAIQKYEKWKNRNEELEAENAKLKADVDEGLKLISSFL